MKKLYFSEHRSEGGNENTDELKLLFGNTLSIKPEVCACPDFDPFPEDCRIKAIRYSCIPFGDKKICVFAYMGFPENASAETPVPAMVLAHGGGGHAYAEWVQYWVNNGYAAISFDGFGQEYTGKPNTYEADLDYWAYNPESQPVMDGFASKDKPFAQQGYAYFIADIILANNILRSDDRVKKDKIGLTGISWGGIAAGTVIGYDSRFAFAAPVYGCGFQDICKTQWGIYFRGDRISDVWDAKLLLPEVIMPVHWFNSDRDPFFDAHSTTACANGTNNAYMTLIPAFTHGQIEGSAIPELLRFADEQNGKGQRNIKITEVYSEESRVVLSFTLPDDVKNADALIYYKTEDLIYKEKYLCEEWKSIQGDVDGTQAVLHIPDDAHIFYFVIRGKTDNLQSEFIHASSGVYTRNSWFKCQNLKG